MEAAVPASRPSGRWLALPVFCLLLCLIIRSAWVTEDAYITLRTVHNLVAGYGLRWNVIERVQAYTHPLWMVLLSLGYYFTREAFFTTIVIGVATSAAAALLLLAQARSAGHGVVALAMLCASRAYVDFGTSGLENPLSHLLLAVFVWLVFHEQASFRAFAFVVALLAVNRMDAVLITFPALTAAGFTTLRAQGLKQTARDLALGLSPFLLWSAFSLFYYGTPFPNTAYAKLNTGIPQAEMTRQGFIYLLTSLGVDASIWVSIPMGLGFALSARGRTEKLLALGVLLQIVYIVRVGGDFMAGRFLTLPLFACALLVARSQAALDVPLHAGSALASLAAMLMLPLPAGWENVANIATTGVVEERSAYVPGGALAGYQRGLRMPNHEWADKGREARATEAGVTVSAHIGYLGYFSGPKSHIVDRLALSDPLLARLPARRNVNWRIGHFSRVLPRGYTNSALASHCRMEDQRLCAYWDQLKLVTRGPLWSWSRWLAIARLNLGSLDHYIDWERYRFPDMARLSIGDLPAHVPDQEPVTSALVRNFTDSGVEVRLPALSHARRISVALDADDDYLLELRKGGQTLAKLFIRAAHSEGILNYARTIPKPARDGGFDTVRILPTQGSDFHMGHLQLAD